MIEHTLSLRRTKRSTLAAAHLPLIVVAVLLVAHLCVGTALGQAVEPKPTPLQAYDAMLAQHVDEHGFVDYAAISQDPESLDRYIEYVGELVFQDLDMTEQLAVLINAYNAFTLKLIVEYYDEGNLKSIFDIPEDKRWNDVRWQVGQHTWSLNQIEHEQIRPTFKEPRIHWVLVCAAYSCPKLLNEAFVPQKLEQQLDAQARYVHDMPRFLQYDHATNTVYLTKLYEWYGGDFDQDGGVLGHVAKYNAMIAQLVSAGKSPNIAYLEYDWRLNDVSNADQ